MELTQAVKALESLAQTSRLKVFRLLAAAGPTGIAAGELARQLEIPSPTLSFHLMHLVNAGLIDVRRESRSKIYGLSVSGIRELLSFLLQDCCGGRADLCSELDAGECSVAKTSKATSCGKAECRPKKRKAKPTR